MPCLQWAANRNAQIIPQKGDSGAGAHAAGLLAIAGGPLSLVPYAERYSRQECTSCDSPINSTSRSRRSRSSCSAGVGVTGPSAYNTNLTSTLRIRSSVLRLRIRQRDCPWKGISRSGGLSPPHPRRDAVSVADEWQDHAEGSRRNGITPPEIVVTVPRYHRILPLCAGQVQPPGHEPAGR